MEKRTPLWKNKSIPKNIRTWSPIITLIGAIMAGAGYSYSLFLIFFKKVTAYQLAFQNPIMWLLVIIGTILASVGYLMIYKYNKKLLFGK